MVWLSACILMVFVYVARKEGYVEKVKELSPKYYYYSRRVKVIMGGGLLTGFAILTTLRVLYGPLPYSQFFPLFLALFVVSLGIIFVGWLLISVLVPTKEERATTPAEVSRRAKRALAGTCSLISFL